MGRTLYEKLWDSHVVRKGEGGPDLLYVDRQLVHEVSSPKAFRMLAERGLSLHRPETHLAVADHAVPTADRTSTFSDKQAQAQVAELSENAARFAIRELALDSAEHGIVHVVGPELGFTLPGTTMVCGDSHTTTHGAFGALAFGIGASECGTVMATQCLQQWRAKTMKVELTGGFSPGVSAKDLSLALIAQIGSEGAKGYAVEYTGPALAQMDMAARMTMCNMTIEAGSRIGLVAPDEVTLDYLYGRIMAPRAEMWDKAVTYWRSLASDSDAEYDRVIRFDLDELAPYVSWGTSPDQAAAITGCVPPACDEKARKALDYMALTPGQPLTEIGIDRVFIGSCTNARIEDLRAAASILQDRHVAPSVRAMVVPGSAATKKMAEDEGLDAVFRKAGFEWRDAGCSMCVAMNNDRLQPGERCASTSNRNFEGRQGQGGRTHLMSPAMAAAAAVSGHMTDVRTMLP